MQSANIYIFDIYKSIYRGAMGRLDIGKLNMGAVKKEWLDMGTVKYEKVMGRLYLQWKSYKMH